jgi:hypothetical protein
MNDISFVVFGTHEYQWALRPFAHLFAKYWGEETVTYVGDRPLKGDLVAVFLPDHWVRRPVQLDTVRAMAGYMLEAGNVVRGNLPDDTNLEGHGKTLATRDGVEIIVCGDIHHCGKEAGVALSPALWDRRKLIDLLEPHWGLWATEKLGTEKMAREHPGWVSIGTRPAALGRMNPIRDGQKRQMRGMPPRKVWLEGLSEEDKQMIKGMIPKKYDIVE